MAGVVAPAGKAVAAPAPAFPLMTKLDLGVIVQGKSAALGCWVTNNGKNPVQVSKIESSCDCLTVTLSKQQIAPGEKILVTASYDGAKEAEFVGSLQIEVNLFDDNQTKVGQIEIPIEVISSDNSSEGKKPKSK